LIKQISSAKELRSYITALKEKDLRIGFVPTMGALHEGHLALVRQCKNENEICISSIFINPTQFNDQADYEKYPRLIDQDILKLASAGCDVVFTPDEEEIYPNKDFTKIKIDLGYVGQVMEGAHRPGHFDGVVTIVKKLFDLVQPHNAYFGQKDYQQFMVIRKMNAHFAKDINLILCETVRESDGLAMSSRNLLLDKDDRKLAPIIFKTMSMAKELLSEKSVAEVKVWAENVFNSENLINFEYFEIVDADTLKPINSLHMAEHIIICTAMKIGNIRLIDNLFVKK
jgi:pantoate--beta-alanine ligase